MYIVEYRLFEQRSCFSSPVPQRFVLNFYLLTSIDHHIILTNPRYVFLRFYYCLDIGVLGLFG